MYRCLLFFPTLVPEHKGAAVSVHNLAAGLSNFCGPAIASVTLMFTTEKSNYLGLCHSYIIGFILTFFMKVQQPTKK